MDPTWTGTEAEVREAEALVAAAALQEADSWEDPLGHEAVSQEAEAAALEAEAGAVADRPATDPMYATHVTTILT